MLDDERDGAQGDFNHAARGANADWDSVPHSANSGLNRGTILGPQRTNRRWAAQEKARITAESFEPGANISAVARRHGVVIAHGVGKKVLRGRLCDDSNCLWHRPRFMS